MRTRVSSNCRICHKALQSGKSAQGCCKKCYNKAYTQGLIVKKKRQTELKECLSCKVMSKLTGDYCQSCYSRFAWHRTRGLDKAKCKKCRCYMPQNVWLNLCKDCDSIKEEIEISDTDLMRLKLLTIKWNNNIIRPDEILEGVSLFCNLKPKVDIDVYTSKRQIELMFKEFKQILDTKFNIYKND